MKYILFVAGACIWLSLGKASYNDLIRPLGCEPKANNSLDSDFNDQLNYISSMVPVGGYEDCNDTQRSLYFIAHEIGATLVIDDTPERGYYSEKHKRYIWGKTNFDTIWVYKPPCYGAGLSVFFHEVGHFLLHEGSRKGFQKKEYEANRFAAEIINHINQ